MSLLDYGQNRYYADEIRKNINNVVPFLGAGISKPYGYPLWEELILKVLESIRRPVSDMTENTYQKIKDFINKKRYMSATEEMYKCWPNLENFVCQEISTIKPINNSCLEKYIHLFPSRLYLTTNYDDVLEKTLRQYFFSDLKDMIATTPTSTTSNMGLRTKTDPILWYLHGKYTNPNSIIFSNADYNYFYGPDRNTNIKTIRRQLLARTLQEIYLRAPFLFIGYGMNMEEDRILKLLKRFNQMGQQPEEFSYVLLEAPKNYTPEQLNNKEKELLTIKVRPIWYFPANENDHEQVKEDLFEYLLVEKRKEYEAKRTQQEKEEEIQQKKQREKEEGIKKFIQKIEDPSNITNRITYYQKYHHRGSNYEFVLIKVDDYYYLSDQGRTFEMLDEVFELNELDVIRNLNKIMRECDVLRINNKLVVRSESWDNLPIEKQEQLFEEARCKLFACVSFMDKMRIFYT